MTDAKRDAVPPTVDLGDCEDVFINGWSAVERLPGNLMRYTGYVQETATGQLQRRVRLRVVVPLEAVMLAMADTKISIANTGAAFMAWGDVLFTLN